MLSRIDGTFLALDTEHGIYRYRPSRSPCDKVTTMDSGLRWSLGGDAATSAFTFLALAFPNMSRWVTIPCALLSLILTLKFLWPEIKEFHAKRRHRMIAITGIIVCACGLVGFGSWYLWLTTTTEPKGATPSVSTDIIFAPPEYTYSLTWDAPQSVELISLPERNTNDKSPLKTLSWTLAVWEGVRRRRM